MNWEVRWVGKRPKPGKSVLIEGLPGIGNVGKVAIDFLIDNFHARRVAEFHSQLMPHSVFVNERGLVELPHIELYAVERKGRTLYFLAGDVQPVNEESCYAFCETLLELSVGLGVDEVVATGGIGLRSVPKKPRVFVTGTTAKAVAPYARIKVNKNIYGTVGPIIGVSGVLVGLSSRFKVPAVALLVEVYGHPMYLGVRGAKELLRVLNVRFGLRLDFKAIEKEIEQLERELTDKTQDLASPPFGAKTQEMNYIG